MTGAQWIVQTLRDNMVNTIFGYPGGAIMPIYDALYESKVKHLLCRHEQGAVIAAIGYARSVRKTGVCIATSGPGATNLITGLADAMMDSVSIVALTGQVSSNCIGTDAFQEIDMLGLSLACTKHSFLVKSLNELVSVINEAFFISKSGRPGPVLIDIPKDIQIAKGNSLHSAILNKKENFFLSDEKIIEARNMIYKSKKPMLYIGGGVGIAKAVSKLRFFAKETGIPIVTTLKGLGSVNSDNDTYLGMIGMHGTKAANFAVQSCDLLIAIGARFDDRVTGKLDTFAPFAKIIHIDIDPAEINKLRSVDISLISNLNYILPALTQKLHIDSWRSKIKKLKELHKWNYNYTNKLIYAPFLLKELSDRKPTNTIITTDVGQHQMWVAQHMSFNSPEDFITSSGLGTMGFGIPAAIGAQIARPKNIVICITGDGSIMMNIQELTTIKRAKLPIKIILLDNQCLGMVRQWQELFFNGRYSETNLSDNPDFLKLASAFDIPGKKISYREEIDSALDYLLKSIGPYFLHVSINEYENVWPLVPPGVSNENMMERIT